MNRETYFLWGFSNADKAQISIIAVSKIQAIAKLNILGFNGEDMKLNTITEYYHKQNLSEFINMLKKYLGADI